MLHKTLAVAVAIGLAGSVALAQSPAAKKKARELITSGDKHLARGDRLMSRGKKVAAQESFLAALADYNAAYEAFNSPKIYFAIGLAEKRLGRYLQALRHFEKMMAELDEIPEQLRSEVERHVNEVKQNLGVIFFRVKPAGAEIEIDGNLIGTSPLNRPHYVVPGEHEFVISKDGYERRVDTIQIEAGDVREDQLALEPLEGTEIVKDDVERRVPDEPTEAKPADVTQLYIGLGVTGGLAVGATITGLLSLSKHNTFEDPDASAAERQDARNSGKTLALITDAMIIGSVAAAAYTTLYYFAVYKKEQNEDSGDVAIVPAASPDGAGLAITGRF